MRKVLVMLVSIMVIIWISLLMSAPIVNDTIAKEIANDLAGLPLPDDTRYIESAYKAGKLVGNGNGMQYFGAILIKSGLSMEQLEGYYSGFAENKWECVVEKQTSADIKLIEHEELAFQTDVAEDDYYIVYTWGDNDTIFHELDVRGH